MKKQSLIVGIAIALFSILLASQVTLAWPSAELRDEPGGIFDDWSINRISAIGENGFLQIVETATSVSFNPLIAQESLGKYSDKAYELGEWFAEEYPDNIQRATKIFEFVRDSIQYTTDTDQFDMPEYAQNADEIAGIISEKATASGDCEEHALLLAVMYLGAGYRAGIALSPGHLAAILYLPEFERANEVFTLNGDEGWIWLEATGNNNPLGWFPRGQVEGPILAYEISPEEHIPFYQPRPPVLESIGDREVDEGEILRFNVSAADANEDPLIYQAINLPETANFNPASGTFSWTPERPGIYPDIRFEVTDGALSDFEEITITVHKVNQPPVLEPIGDKEVNEDEVLRFSISATDLNDDTLTYSARNLPEGAHFDVTDGTFSWTPDTPGTYTHIHFEVSDGTLANSEDITVIVLAKGNPVLIIASVTIVCIFLLALVIVIYRRKARHT